MKINFTNKQFLSLMKMVYLGDWMINAHRTKTINKYEELESYIFSYAKDFGLGDYVDKEIVGDGNYYPTRKFEEETDVHKFHEEYDEETFWDEIIARLEERDFYQKYGVDQIKKMKPEERLEKRYEFEKKYTDEINKYGIERISIKQ